jgi:hypothetical protein
MRAYTRQSWITCHDLLCSELVLDHRSMSYFPHSELSTLSHSNLMDEIMDRLTNYIYIQHTKRYAQTNEAAVHLYS